VRSRGGATTIIGDARGPSGCGGWPVFGVPHVPPWPEWVPKFRLHSLRALVAGPNRHEFDVRICLFADRDVERRRCAREQATAVGSTPVASQMNWNSRCSVQHRSAPVIAIPSRIPFKDRVRGFGFLQARSWCCGS
jgi:hypothetical protein